MNTHLITVFVAVAAFAGLLVDCRTFVLSGSGTRTPPVGFPTVIGGMDAVDGQFPYALEMEYYGALGWKHQCTAVLIDPYYAITGAKCVNNFNVINVRVWAGMLVRENYTLTNAQQISVNQIIVHPSYSEYVSGIPYDIAVLRFSWAADLARPNVALATLPADNSNDFHVPGCTIIGWGRYGPDQTFAWTLQYAYNDVITNAECTYAMTGISNSQIWDTHLCCQSNPVGIGVCSGDSGSPVLCTATGTDTGPIYVAGIASWTVMNAQYCNENFPTVYVRIGHPEIRDFITTNTPPYP